MDFQCSYGRSVLLKYVTSYVTKMKEDNILKGLMAFFFFALFKLSFLWLVIVLFNFLNTSYIVRGMVIQGNILLSIVPQSISYSQLIILI